ncbi:MAG: VWA domain-containing protein [Bryobacteraceae bacterium]
MFLLNLTAGQLLVLFGSLSTLVVTLYLLDRSRRRQTVATLKFWVSSMRPVAVKRRRRIQQPLSLLLQVLSILLLLLALAQPRFGGDANASRDHVLVLETSAWMRSRPANGGGEFPTLMDEARGRALAYIRALPSGDRVMVVRADALATPANVFDADRKKLREIVSQSHPSATALNLAQALSFAKSVQNLSARRQGEIVFVGSGRISERESMAASPAALKNLRVLPVSQPAENCGLRKVGLRKSPAQSDLWEIYVSARNYGDRPKSVVLALQFGGAPAGSRRLTLPPGQEQEAVFEYRTRAAGILEARLLTKDGLPDDDRAVLELPSQRSLGVLVYSNEPDLLKPILLANSRVRAEFLPTSAYQPGREADIVILDRFRPPARPETNSIWIDPPADGSPVPIRSRVGNVRFTRWRSDHPLGGGLRTRDLRLDAASIFEAAPDDVTIGEVEGGPVIVARPGKPNTIVLGFHPMRSGMRYQIATPLLFANLLRWMAPEIFRRVEASGGSAGTVNISLNPEIQPSDVAVQTEDGTPLPFTLRNETLHFYAGAPGIFRVLTGDRESVHSLTLPELSASRWAIPATARTGIPNFLDRGISSRDWWPLFAILGALGLLAEWMLYGRYSRGLVRPRQVQEARRAAVRRAS